MAHTWDAMASITPIVGARFIGQTFMFLSMVTVATNVVLVASVGPLIRPANSPAVRARSDG